MADTPPAAAGPARPASRVKRLAAAALEASLITALTFGLIAGSAFAAKGGGGTKGGGGGHGGGGHNSGGGGTLALVMVTDQNVDGGPDWGDTITFAVTSSSEYPTVEVLCYQDGTMVYSAGAGFYPSYPWPGARNMPLSSPSWTAGSANCSAALNGTIKLTFTAGA